IGRGEALNEVTSGHRWPSNIEKFRRLKEAIHLIKKLWIEDWVDFRGDYYWVLTNRIGSVIWTTYDTSEFDLF
ncbi:MAG: hypothetical protein WAZ77_16085, partial [Candidatus Nitrosopolaris sp.]